MQGPSTSAPPVLLLRQCSKHRLPLLQCSRTRLDHDYTYVAGLGYQVVEKVWGENIISTFCVEPRLTVCIHDHEVGAS
jgi:hypothetical protein